ncbi:hypothetical protein [Corynebacterium variabile]|uniref:J domain-containing protein n=1 Tax=Corynebacterium variabile TaxID=1727 RepID=UPI003A906F37
MTDFVNFYDLLGLKDTANEEEIKGALQEEFKIWTKRASMSTKPDVKQAAEKRLRDLSAAEKTLLDPAARSAFDSTRHQRAAEAQREEMAQTRSTANSSAEWVERAKQFYAQGKGHSAHYAAKHATLIDGENAEAWFVAGQASFMQKEWADCGVEFNHAISLDPTNAEFHFEYAESLSGLGGWKEAKPSYELALQLEPNNLLYKAMVASCWRHLENFQKAYDMFVEILNVNDAVDFVHDEAARSIIGIIITSGMLPKNFSHVGNAVRSPEAIAFLEEQLSNFDQLRVKDEGVRATAAELRKAVNWAKVQHFEVRDDPRFWLGAAGAAVLCFILGVNGFPMLFLLGLVIVGGGGFIFWKRSYRYGWMMNAGKYSYFTPMSAEPAGQAATPQAVEAG